MVCSFTSDWGLNYDVVEKGPDWHWDFYCFTAGWCGVFTGNHQWFTPGPEFGSPLGSRTGYPAGGRWLA